MHWLRSCGEILWRGNDFIHSLSMFVLVHEVFTSLRLLSIVGAGSVCREFITLYILISHSDYLSEVVRSRY